MLTLGVVCICLLRIAFCSSLQCFSIFGNNNSKCKPGEFLTQNKTCQACPANSYMDKDNHTCMYCFPCTNYSLLFDAVAWTECTSVKDRVITKCKPNLYPSEIECSRCPYNGCDSEPACCDSSHNGSADLDATISSPFVTDSSTSTLTNMASASSTTIPNSTGSDLSRLTCTDVCSAERTKEESRNVSCRSLSGETIQCEDCFELDNRKKCFEDVKTLTDLETGIIIALILLFLIIAVVTVFIVMYVKKKRQNYHLTNADSDHSESSV